MGELEYHVCALNAFCVAEWLTLGPRSSMEALLNYFWRPSCAVVDVICSAGLRASLCSTRPLHLVMSMRLPPGPCPFGPSEMTTHIRLAARYSLLSKSNQTELLMCTDLP